MLRIFLGIVVSLAMITPTAAEDCSSILFSMRLPKVVKTRGKPKVAKWEDTDKVINELQERLQGLSCTYRFDQLFDLKDDRYFPLTNSTIRLVPEASLMDTDVYNNSGDLLGAFSGKIQYERSGNLYAKKSYKVYYFQYKNSSGKFQSVGSELLLDKYLLKWEDIKSKTALSTRGDAAE